MATLWKTETDSLLKTNSTETSVQLLLFLFLASLKNQGQILTYDAQWTPGILLEQEGDICPLKVAAPLRQGRPKYLVKVTIIVTKAYIIEYYGMPDSIPFIFTTILRTTITPILKMTKLRLRKFIFPSYYTASKWLSQDLNNAPWNFQVCNANETFTKYKIQNLQNTKFTF